MLVEKLWNSEQVTLADDSLFSFPFFIIGNFAFSRFFMLHCLKIAKIGPCGITKWSFVLTSHFGKKTTAP